MNEYFIDEKDVSGVILKPMCLKKYYNTAVDVSGKIIQKFFKIDNNNLRISSQTVDESSYPDECFHITKIIKILFPKAKVITDATAGVGCNTINFCKYFKKVNAVEVDPNEFQRLKGNVEAHKIKSKKLDLYNDSYINILEKKLEQDVVFIHPPYGGDKHKCFDKLYLCLGKVYVHHIINYILKNTLAKMVVLKAPTNAYLPNLEYASTRVQVYREDKHVHTIWIFTKIKVSFSSIDTTIKLKKK